uniref:Lecithin retinol acyltransferase b, tandem duplicate 2 n=1 Tax=Acanthochromis polyacanthus TaxID=80966 RepID=A0A3Q1FK69_9TELE
FCCCVCVCVCVCVCCVTVCSPVVVCVCFVTVCSPVVVCVCCVTVCSTAVVCVCVVLQCVVLLLCVCVVLQCVVLLLCVCVVLQCVILLISSQQLYKPQLLFSPSVRQHVSPAAPHTDSRLHGNTRTAAGRAGEEEEEPGSGEEEPGSEEERVRRDVQERRSTGSPSNSLHPLWDLPGRRQCGSIRVDSVEDFAYGSEILVNPMDRMCSRAALQEEDVACRAEKLLGNVEYSLLWYNCEHYVMYCRYGTVMSFQTFQFCKTVRKLLLSRRVAKATALLLLCLLLYVGAASVGLVLLTALLPFIIWMAA